MKYQELELKRNLDMKQFSWNGKEIKVMKYLSIEAKYDIVMITIQEAYELGIYNPIKLDMCFHVNLVLMYTDLEFTEEEKDRIEKLYDEMVGSGFMAEFLKQIDPKDYKEMQEYIEEIIKAKTSYDFSAFGAFDKIINSLPDNAAAMKEIMDTFDQSKYQNVVNFAKAINNDRLPDGSK